MTVEDAQALIAPLRVTIRSQEAIIQQQHETIAQLEATIAQLEATIAQLEATIAQLEATIAQLEERVASGEGQKASPPPWAKANRPERAPKERHKRAPEHNGGRQRSTPTRIEEHAYARCPDCDYALRGHTIDRRREVIDLPLAPVEVVEHRVITRYCPVCQRWQAPPLDTDFYAAYNGVLGRKQRFWAHLLRDLHALTEAHPADEEVRVWAEALYALYQRGHECLSLDLSAAQRKRAYRPLEDRTRALGHCYALRKGHPCQTLAQRLLRHRGEFFEFVRVPEVEATNNLAERSLRPLVIARKISGGSRSPQGTTSRLDLASLFESWHAQGQNPFHACLALLQTPSPQL